MDKNSSIMANYEDYQLEDMENDAVNKSNNWKKAAVVGAAVLGVGGTAAYGASKLMDGQNEALNADDMMSMAEAGEITDEVVDQPAPQVQEVHNHTHVEVKPAPAPAEPEVSVDETGVVFDEDGNYVGMFDSGTIDGKEFAVFDRDGNGRADVLAYDENGNGVFENHEIVEMDNQSYVMGQGEHVQAYVDTPGGLVAVEDYQDPTYMGPYQTNDDLSGIHNDFQDEKHNGESMNDLAHNNPDYNNHDEGNDYNASMEPSMEMDYTEKYDGVAEDTYGAADDYTPESYDDIANDNLADNSDMGGFDEGADYMA